MPINITETAGDVGEDLIKSDLFVTVFTNSFYVGILVAIIIILIAMLVYVDDSGSSIVKFVVYSCLVSVVIQHVHSTALKNQFRDTKENREAQAQLSRLANPDQNNLFNSRVELKRDDFIQDLNNENNDGDALWNWDN